MYQAHSYIYLITNTENGKLYVGRTKNPKTRWRAHKNSKSTSKQLISRAIAKYGKDVFRFDLVYAAFSLEDIIQKEEYFIRYYKSHHKDGFGYNMTYAAQGSYPGSIPWNKGKIGIYTEATLSTMRERKKNYVPWNKGKKGLQIPSEETRQKLSVASKLARSRKFWTTKKNGDSVSALPEGAS